MAIVKAHWSSCALHNLPADFPMPCDCGGFIEGKSPEEYLRRKDYSLGERVRNVYLLWRNRIYWKQENHVSLGCFLLTVASHSVVRLKKNIS